MKILIIEPVPCFGGGSEAVALELCKNLSQRGHSMFLAYASETDMLPLYKTCTIETWKVDLQVFGWRCLKQSLRSVIELGNFIRSRGIELVFSSHLGFLRTLALVRIFYRTKTIYHLGLPVEKIEHSIRWATRMISFGVAPSERVARTWEKCGWRKEGLRVIRNWVDFERFKPVDDQSKMRAELGLPQSAPLVLYVGRIVPEKGVEILLRAFSKLLERIPGSILVMVGRVDEQYASKLDRLQMELEIPKMQCMRVGVSLRPECYLASADVTVVPSIWDEPFGLVLLEAMGCGSLTLASSAGELAGILGEANRDLVIPAADSKAWAEALQYWLGRPQEARRRGLQLREYATAAFNKQDPINNYEALMRSAFQMTSRGTMRPA